VQFLLKLIPNGKQVSEVLWTSLSEYQHMKEGGHRSPLKVWSIQM